MSLRFFGLLYPHISLSWYRGRVDWFLPRMFQFLRTSCGIELSCGWYVVMRKIFCSSSASSDGSGGFSKTALSLFLARAAASLSRSKGYFLRRKCDDRLITCLSKSVLLVQILLTLRNWLYGMLSLHLCGVQNCSKDNCGSQWVWCKGL